MSKILIADDSQFMRTVLKTILAKAGYADVAEAKDGREALALLDKLKPDILLLDIIMPGMDGMEVLSQAGQDHNIVMVTAIGQEEMVKKAMSLGAKDFVVKPFNSKKVVEIVDKVLGKSV